jgi:hypothetical protein
VATTKKSTTPPDEVEVELAHPWAYADEVYGVGDKAKVPSDLARALIGAGYASGVDPEDQAAVAKALGLDPVPAVLPAGTAVPPGPHGTSA